LHAAPRAFVPSSVVMMQLRLMLQTRYSLSALAAGAALVLTFGCSGDGYDFDDSDGNTNETIDNPTGSGGTTTTSSGSGGGVGAAGGGATGGGGVCQPDSQISCYSGPQNTEGVGLCKAGLKTCNADGSGYGPCTGEVTPTTEVCATQGDDDCDGMTNEDGPDCSCTPGQFVECYSGPANTKNVGICKPGSQKCKQDGSGYEACIGETLPAQEDCKTAADEDCDGQTPPCAGAIVDLRADNNRNGTVDLNDPSEDLNESTWSASNGAVFLANIDDDQSTCPTSGSDAQLEACNDAADNVTNGSNDLADLARLKTVPWPDAPSNSSGYLGINDGSVNYVRLFKKTGSNFTHYVPGGNLTPTDLKNGVEFAIEALDFVRDKNAWNGYVTVTLHVNGGDVTGGKDSLVMRVAPVVFRHHLDPVETYYVTKFTNYQPSLVFRNDLAVAATAAGISAHNVYEQDQWTQDFFETAYMAMPKQGGKHVIHVNFRSANYTGSLRTAGRTVFTDLRGKDVAGAVQYDPGHNDGMDTLNSFGNTETIPPYGSWKLGRVLRGSTSGFYPDQSFDKMIKDQNVQGLVTVDTSWLLVAHVDETISFIKANTPRGWALLANDAALAKQMLEQHKSNGYGNTDMFIGKYWSNNAPAQISINEVLADTDVMNESAWAVVKVDDQLLKLKQETGLTDSEIVPVPFLHDKTSGYSVAYNPGTVNGIYMSDKVFAAPDPHGPVINGSDIFKAQLKSVLTPYGVDVYWIENWDLYHRLLGEVHCGTNATRVVPANAGWWEIGK